MQRGTELGGKFAEMGLRSVGDFLEIDHYAGLVGAHGVIHDVTNQILAGGFVAEEGGHFFNAPGTTVVIVEQAHDGKFDVGGLHPAMELVVSQESYGLRGACFHSLIALVVDDGQGAVWRYGVELIGDENVDVFVVLL